jgi:hypothetical protein
MRKTTTILTLFASLMLPLTVSAQLRIFACERMVRPGR